MADAVGYHITLQQQRSDGSSLVKSESYDRSANQNYLFLPGNTCFVFHVFNIYLPYLYILFINIICLFCLLILVGRFLGRLFSMQIADA